MHNPSPPLAPHAALLLLPPLSQQDYGVEKDADGDEGVALRATFIISDKGIVRHAEIADLPIGRNPEETVRLVQAFKFADEHGEVSASLLLHTSRHVMHVPPYHGPRCPRPLPLASRLTCCQVCPASWKPGKATMKPDPKGSQEYFKTLPQ